MTPRQPTPSSLAQCARITEDAARLKCFDGLAAPKNKLPELFPPLSPASGQNVCS